MENYRETIKSKLNEAKLNPQSVAKSIGDTVNVVKSTLGADDAEAKEIVKGYFTVGENEIKEGDSNLRSVKVSYSNGETQGISMGAHLTDEEILNYFKIGKVFNLGKNGVEDNLQKVTKVEILDKTPMTTESVRPRMTKSEFEKVIKESH